MENNNNKKAKSVVKANTCITQDETEYVKFLVQNTVENVNQKYSKKLSLGDIEQRKTNLKMVIGIMLLSL